MSFVCERSRVYHWSGTSLRPTMLSDGSVSLAAAKVSDMRVESTRRLLARYCDFRSSLNIDSSMSLGKYAGRVARMMVSISLRSL